MLISSLLWCHSFIKHNHIFHPIWGMNLTRRLVLMYSVCCACVLVSASRCIKATWELRTQMKLYGDAVKAWVCALRKMPQMITSQCVPTVNNKLAFQHQVKESRETQLTLRWWCDQKNPWLVPTFFKNSNLHNKEPRQGGVSLWHRGRNWITDQMHLNRNCMFRVNKHRSALSTDFSQSVFFGCLLPLVQIICLTFKCFYSTAKIPFRYTWTTSHFQQLYWAACPLGISKALQY